MDQSTDAGMVGPFWVVEADRQATIIALAVPLKGADVYGDMLTVDFGHLEHWSRLGPPRRASLTRGRHSDRASLVGVRGMAAGSRAL
jgi:hypothetical protein